MSTYALSSSCGQLCGLSLQQLRLPQLRMAHCLPKATDHGASSPDGIADVIALHAQRTGVPHVCATVSAHHFCLDLIHAPLLIWRAKIGRISNVSDLKQSCQPWRLALRNMDAQPGIPAWLQSFTFVGLAFALVWLIRGRD